MTVHRTGALDTSPVAQDPSLWHAGKVARSKDLGDSQSHVWSIRAVPARPASTIKDIVTLVDSAITMGTDAGLSNDYWPPAVVLDNGYGIYRKVLESDTYEDALEEADRLRDELRFVGFNEWRQRHDVSTDFLSRRPLKIQVRKIPRLAWRRFRTRHER
jgi:hypothetical protein